MFLKKYICICGNWVILLKRLKSFLKLYFLGPCYVDLSYYPFNEEEVIFNKLILISFSVNWFWNHIHIMPLMYV